MKSSRLAALSSWWHGLPWNGLFWLTVLLLLGSGSFFTVSAHLERESRIGVEAEAMAEVIDGGRAKVALILNGDEIVIEDAEKRRARLRMLGIHAFDPVVNEREITAFGEAALRFLEQWVLNKEVTIFFDKVPKDSRGRYLGYVHLDDVDINRRMVEEGVAMVYTEFATAREQAYLITEQGARRAGRGLWGGKKARARIAGLRAGWQSARTARDGSPPIDPLLEEDR
jgi:endonuclease YncB( thermonuclease family)